MKFKILTLLITFAISISSNSFASENGQKNKKYKSIDNEETNSGYEPFTGSPNSFQQDASIGLGINYFDSFGLQGRYAYRLLDKGFIQDFNDALFFEGGVGTTFYGTVNSHSSVVGFNFLFSARWDLNYDSKWTLFGTLGFGINAVTGVKNRDVIGGGFYPALGVGTYYMMKDNFGLRFDLTYQFLGISALVKF